jgi:hypothetical protein
MDQYLSSLGGKSIELSNEKDRESTKASNTGASTAACSPFQSPNSAKKGRRATAATASVLTPPDDSEDEVCGIADRLRLSSRLSSVMFGSS